MTEISKSIKSFLADEEGQGMVEYGLILALIAVVVIAVLTAIGGAMKTKYTDVESALKVTP